MSNSQVSSAISSELSPATQIADLSSRLQERDKLVDVLTQRLEAAAEQLDRIRRTGGDRPGAGQGGGGSLPRELVQQQQSLAEKLEDAVEQWQGIEPQKHFERIEDRLDSLIDMVRGGGFVGGSSRGGEGGASRESFQRRKEDAAPAKPAASATGGSSAAMSSWEAMKAQLMGEAPPKPEQPEQMAADSSDSEPPSKTSENEEEIAGVPSPIIIDIEKASLEELKEAVTTRDTYISTMLRQFRVVTCRQPIDWASVRALAPEDLRETFLTFEKRLREELQREELDISLERAKVARERGQLDQIRTRLEREIRKMNTQPGQEAPAANGNSPEAAAESQPSAAGRWKGILGLGKGKK